MTESRVHSSTSETRRTRTRYERISRIYDWLEILPELRYATWRSALWERVEGVRILEVGVGTGKNLPFYPKDAEITALDLTPGMLQRAKKKARSQSSTVALLLGDVQALPFPANSFDAVVATFVFCSVPNPILGLQEVKRVLRSGGRLYLLEHMRAENAVAGAVMDLLDPIIVPLMGLHINRSTVGNVVASGLKLTLSRDLWLNGIFKMLIAEKE